mmetsp:Transcript_21890/g.69915  ORF Transcript_21890/g.69915 Transcript_21890/m.69915 type:complete len:236 (-) Transcript_21890:380-1087(-)
MRASGQLFGTAAWSWPRSSRDSAPSCVVHPFWNSEAAQVSYFAATRAELKIPRGDEGCRDALQTPDLDSLAIVPGIVGLTAAHLGAGRCVLTDLPDLVDLLRRNVASNSAGDGGAVVVAPLVWGSPRSEFPVEVSGSAAPDLVLCSDLLYEPKGHQPLVDTLAEVCGLATTILFTVKLRFPEREAAFFELLERQLSMKVLGGPAAAVGADCPQGISVFVARRGGIARKAAISSTC